MWVYKITNLVNNKCYIGITNNLEYRWHCHRNAPNYPYLKNPLYSAIRKYGIENFEFKVEEEGIQDIVTLGQKERYYIRKYHSHVSENGYNLTWGGERSQYDANPRTSLTVEDVMEIRTIYNEGNIGVTECWKQYSNRISYSAFEKIWEGVTWKGIMDYVYTEENKNKQNCFKSNKGSKNGNAIYSEEEVLDIRKYYTNHSLSDTYNKYGSKSASKESFRGLIDSSYKHLPIYSKKRKQWSLNGSVIDINNFNPVSTISVSGE